jgi:hypothetical protein
MHIANWIISNNIPNTEVLIFMKTVYSGEIILVYNIDIKKFRKQWPDCERK